MIGFLTSAEENMLDDKSTNYYLRPNKLMWEIMVVSISDQIEDQMDKNIPRRNQRDNNDPSWFNKEINKFGRQTIDASSSHEIFFIWKNS